MQNALQMNSKPAKSTKYQIMKGVFVLFMILNQIKKNDFTESDNEEKNNQDVALWARSKEYLSVIQEQDTMDPDEIFGPLLLKYCDLESIFREFPQKPRYHQRTKSGDWNEDRVTLMEDDAYKKIMGWK
ncbi:hypothetical protein RFI_06864 [Reticulomyxa filosa]|uniref:Inner centromere protein ARK-binding domain-containing protein n=1 Tax=Reticulomyxa filosa TaxID=46433 RepID=X6NVC1_RETFI|nr:hypothetical protein RFI_06864 [Reticulomyxa filosa]|eukprot:ETO30255.1 hypothetical protein RFI_06864 [Reticulomyxa filosa]